MPTIAPASPHTVLDGLHQSLDHVLTILNQKWPNVPLSLKPVGALSIETERRSFVLEGPAELSAEIHFVALPLGDDTFEVQVEVEDGPIRRFTYAPSDDDTDSETMDHLGRKVSAFLLHEIEPRLGQTPVQLSTGESNGHVPTISLDREGMIQHLNEPARSVLEHAPEEKIEPNFFTHVDGHNLRRVMRDLAQMVRDGMKRARWLLRLNTGTDNWRWYRAAVRNELRSEGEIQVHLRPLGEKQRGA